MTDQYYMELALKLAKSTEGQTTPNPMVGAIVVKDGVVVGMGAHLKAGEKHAEVHAIEMAGEKAKGATIYVTLEPCSHYGKTPPCANLIVESKIKRAVIAMKDPFPDVSGNGIQKLKDAGIEVDVGLLEQEAKELNKVFFHHIHNKKPFVTLKSATSLDGKVATRTGVSKWITGEEARNDAQKYRHQHDGILVGINTIIADNPSLTARIPKVGGKNPVRIILDSSLKIPIDSKVLQDKLAKTWIMTTEKADKQKCNRLEEIDHVKVIKFSGDHIKIDELLNHLYEQGIYALFIEGGATVNSSFLEAKAVQQVVTYLSPLIIGGTNAPSSFMGKGSESLEDALNLNIVSIETIGKDIKIVSVPKG